MNQLLPTSPLPQLPVAAGSGHGWPLQRRGPNPCLGLCLGLCLGMWLAVTPTATDAQSPANRLTYLDAGVDPYYVHRDFPRLTTPQWLGEPGVEAVVILAIDDMQQSEPYEVYLRPILDRLQAIDGRAPVSIMANRVDPQDPRLPQWLEEGLSLETHTWTHPCPCLANHQFGAALQTYQQCVDALASVPHNRPVAFRMPCCDSMNSPSPRFYAEIFARPTPAGHALSIDSSVLHLFTPDDPALPRAAVLRPDGQPRFPHYVPFPNYVNKIENYPYPYQIGSLCWQFPCLTPSDWQGQHVQAANNPDTVRDLKIAVDLTLLQQGALSFVFHPHGWMRNDQVVELIDHVVERHGSKVKFMTFAEAHDRLQNFLLAGQPLRGPRGEDPGVRLLDINDDGYLDVVIANESRRLTRIWSPATQAWQDSDFPVPLVTAIEPTSAPTAPTAPTAVQAESPTAIQPQSATAAQGESATFGQAEPATLGRWGVMNGGRVIFLADGADGLAAWQWSGSLWEAAPAWLRGLPAAELRLVSEGRDQGVRLRDLDNDGQCELIRSGPAGSTVWRWDGQAWQVADYNLPADVAIVDAWGRDAGLRWVDVDGDGTTDVLFSNEQRYSLSLGRFDAQWRFVGWPVEPQRAVRHAESQVIPPIVRDVPPGGPLNNGVWFARRTLWMQNESTSDLSDKVDRRSFDELLGDLAAIPAARSPQQSLRALQTRPELQVELVAHEPLVVDPVAFDWGPDGRLWVAEMRDYPNGLDGQGQAGGRIRVLSDTNGDGRYDSAQIFLEDVPFPTGVKVWRKGILVTAAPEIFYAEDTDGDGRADRREVLYRGFVEGNQQHRVNGLQWGLDNWLHVANGDSGGVVQSLRTGETLPIGGRDLRIEPDSGGLVAESGMTQFGRTCDDWGNWFGCNNTYPIWHYVLSDVDLRRNPHFAPRDMRHHVSVTPGAAPVFPLSRTLPRFNDFHMVDRFTSACGLTIYRDRLLGPSFSGNYFVCEPVHNLVQREVMTPAGSTFRSQRAEDEQSREFLASADHWFRPVMARTGPDGALWVADMYRLVIEHPEWIPAAWQARLNLRAGDDMGRLYRVFPRDLSPPRLPRLDQLTPAQWVQQLASENGWVRDMAQQLLVWEGDRSVVGDLQSLVRSSPHPEGRLHALATLHGLNSLASDDLCLGVRDAHPGVRRWALRLAMPHVDEDAELRTAILQQLAQEADPQVWLQAAVLLGASRSADFSQQVAARIVPRLDDAYLRTAWLSSLQADNVASLLTALLEAWPATAASEQESGLAEVLQGQLRFVVASDRVELWEPLAEALLPLPEEQAPVGELSRWLERQEASQGTAARVWRLQALSELLAGWPTARRQELSPVWQKRLEQIWTLTALDDSTAPAAVQVAQVRLLGQVFWEPKRAMDALLGALSPRSAPEVQVAAVRSLARFADDSIVDRLLQPWLSYSPGLRNEILDVVLARNDWIPTVLAAVTEGRIPVAHLNASRRQQLLQHRSASIRRRAEEAFAGGVTSNRQALIEQYAEVASLAPQADVDRGRAVFRQHCANCHRLENFGHAVGPDLAAFVDKSDAGLLAAILDPNRAIEDRYQEYLALDWDGRQHRGVIATETSNALTLLAAEGKQVELLRSEIEQLAATGQSLMPEGLEKDLPPPAMADLFRYLRSSRPPHKVFPGNEPDYPFVRDDGSIRLLATNGRIYGPSLVFEPGYRNLGFWGSAEDRAVWTIRVPRSGRYGITLDYACADDVAGNRFVIQVAGQSVGGVVAGTGSWDEYAWRDVGFVELEAGEHELVFRSDGPIQQFLLDLRSVVLWP